MRNRGAIGQRASGRHHFLCRMADDLKGASILDLGCGFGWFESHALDAGCSRITGVDTDPLLIKRARSEASEALFLCCDAAYLPEDIGSFNMVTMFDFFEHVPRAKQVSLLKKTRRLLLPDGRLLISVPYRSLLSTLLDPAFYLGHRHYSLSRIKAMLDQAGFELLKVRYAGGIWEQLSMIWLYLFKWAFAREMPFQSFLEKRRVKEYEEDCLKPGRVRACVTMFVEAAVLAG